MYWYWGTIVNGAKINIGSLNKERETLCIFPHQCVMANIILCILTGPCRYVCTCTCKSCTCSWFIILIVQEINDWLENEAYFIIHVPVREKNYTGAMGNFAPEMQKRALEKQKRAPENCHRLPSKSMFNVADLVNGMWNIAPENKKLIFGLSILNSKMCIFLCIQLNYMFWWTHWRRFDFAICHRPHSEYYSQD